MSKKLFKNLLALMLSFVMAFGGASSIFAYDGAYGEHYGGFVQNYDEAMAFGDIVVSTGNVAIQTNRGSTSVAHSFMIMPDGTLWGWGSNWQGQLGDGTNISHQAPIKIMDNVAMVSAGSNYTMAITADGTLWGWGQNWFGNLGDGTSTGRYSPVHIMDNVAMVSAGVRHTMAITTDGSLWGWGNNSVGQIGDGTTTDRHSPVWIASGVATVSVGDDYTMAITNDGNLWGWGSN